MQPQDMTESMFRGLTEHGRLLFNELMAAANSAADGRSVMRVGYAALQEGNQLPEPLPDETLSAVKELQDLGLDVRVSRGDTMRVIQLVGVRVQGNRGAA